ncbi:nodulation protein NfeD [Sediminibacillus dalangtanensis]|uniref:Nodulation protein NfeD n=1 Tax=Sediminibacillus dalangtanensis TaxID=2729421 RepID=A0ABX7VTH9_9BACI|nr:NfeD family protein [Sediminibacillus dalangtanensis]QTM99843.1 nodulation protein NfeD [Sediminibacillus dalangtanensis]
MDVFSADWMSFILTGLGTLFLFGELLVNRRGFFGIIGLGFITIYFLSFLAPGAFVLMMVIYLIGLLLIIIDGKFLNDGTLATIGAVCMILSIGLSSPNWTAGLYGIIGVVIGGFCSLLFLKVFKRREMWSKLALVDQLTSEKGYNSMNETYASLVGREAITVTDMRPVGTIRVDGEDYSAVTNGQWIPRETAVRVVQVDGTKILVSKNKQ